MQLMTLKSKYTILLYQIYFLITWFKYFEFIINHHSKSYNKTNKKDFSRNDQKLNYCINHDYDAYANLASHTNDNIKINNANGAMSAAFRVAFNDTMTSDNAKALKDVLERRENEAMSGGFSPLPADFEQSGGGTISLSLMSDFQLHPTDGSGGGAYQFDSNGQVFNPRHSGRVDSVAPESYLMGARWSGKFLDLFTKGRGLTFGKVSFMYQLPKTQGRMIFKYGKFRLQYGKTWGGSLKPWYKRTYLKIPGKTNKHWPWD